MQRLHRRCLFVGFVVSLTGALLTRADDAPATRPSAPAAQPATEPLAAPAGKATTQAAQGAQPAHVGPATAPSSATQPTTRPAKITLNFKDAPLDAVLDYLSDAAGFEVIREGPVDGRVNLGRC